MYVQRDVYSEHIYSEGDIFQGRCIFQGGRIYMAQIDGSMAGGIDDVQM